MNPSGRVPVGETALAIILFAEVPLNSSSRVPEAWYC